jgi:hypothetical protein
MGHFHCEYFLCLRLGNRCVQELLRVLRSFEGDPARSTILPNYWLRVLSPNTGKWILLFSFMTILFSRMPPPGRQHRREDPEWPVTLRVFGCLRRREGVHGGRRPKSLEGGNRGGSSHRRWCRSMGNSPPLLDLICGFRTGRRLSDQLGAGFGRSGWDRRDDLVFGAPGFVGQRWR